MRGAATVGEMLKTARLDQSITQQRLAKKVGVSRSVVSRVEAGATGLTLRTMERFAVALGARLVINLHPLDQWQSIETAPKDGRAVFLLTAAFEADCGPMGMVYYPPIVLTGWWWPQGTSWVDESGELGGEWCKLAITGTWRSGTGWVQPDEVTHWAAINPPEITTATEPS